MKVAFNFKLEYNLKCAKYLVKKKKEEGSIKSFFLTSIIILKLSSEWEFK